MPNGSTRTMRVFEENGRLMASPRDRARAPSFRRATTCSPPAVDPVIRLVFTVEGDRATKLAIQQGGRTFEGPRSP
jgi:hypothetical protein